MNQAIPDPPPFCDLLLVKFGKPDIKILFKPLVTASSTPDAYKIFVVETAYRANNLVRNFESWKRISGLIWQEFFVLYVD